MYGVKHKCAHRLLDIERDYQFRICIERSYMAMETNAVATQLSFEVNTENFKIFYTEFAHVPIPVRVEILTKN